MNTTLASVAVAFGLSALALVAHLQQIPAGGMWTALLLMTTTAAGGAIVGYRLGRVQTTRTKEIATTVARIREDQKRAQLSSDQSDTTGQD